MDNATYRQRAWLPHWMAKMRAEVFGLLLSTVLLAGPASAYDPYDPANCNGGVEWDDKRALVVSQVTAKPRVNFVKSPYDDDFTGVIAVPWLGLAFFHSPVGSQWCKISPFDAERLRQNLIKLSARPVRDL